MYTKWNVRIKSLTFQSFSIIKKLITSYIGLRSLRLCMSDEAPVKLIRIDQGFTDVWIYRRRVLMLHFCWDDEISKAIGTFTSLSEKKMYLISLFKNFWQLIKKRLCSSKQVYGRKTSEVISIVIKNLIFSTDDWEPYDWIVSL